MKIFRLFSTGNLLVTGVCSLMLLSCSSTKETACVKYKRNTKYAGKPTANLGLIHHKYGYSGSSTFNLQRELFSEEKDNGRQEGLLTETDNLETSRIVVENLTVSTPDISQGISDRDRERLLASAQHLNLPDATIRTEAEASSIQAELTGTSSMNPVDATVTKKELRKFRRGIRNELVKEFKTVTPVYQNDNAAPPAKGMAVASLILGLVGLIVFGYIAGTLAIVFGAIALSRIKKNPGQKGMGMAVAGLVLGILDVVLLAILMAGL